MTGHKAIIEAARKIVALYDAEAVAFKEVGHRVEKFMIANAALEYALSEDGPDIARAFIALHARCTKLETALGVIVDDRDGAASPGIKELARVALTEEKAK